jgi:hypothetical protein
MIIILNREGLRKFLAIIAAMVVTYGIIQLIMSLANSIMHAAAAIRLAFLALWAIGLILYHRLQEI